MYLLRIRSLVAALSLAGLAAGSLKADPAPVLLISMDAFRWDYCALHPAETVHIRKIAAEGISAQSLIPVYPSNTFPNHYAIATGLYPGHHGIINNIMFDPLLGEYFYYNRAKYSGDSRWWGGEPIWITAVREGYPSACSFWIGSEAAINGLRPTYWKHYNYSIPFSDRLEELVGWLKQPVEKRPVITTFYLEETNSAGHKYGPDSKETLEAIKLLDSRIGAIDDRLKAEGIAINLVLVSDHGMVLLKPDSNIFLDDYISLKDVQVDFDGPVCGLRPLKGNAAGLVESLSKLPHAKAFLSKDLPERFHLKGSQRIPPVWIMVDEGYELHTRGWLNYAKEYTTVGEHGYDPQYPDMHGILIARGPSFKEGGSVVNATPNIDIYNLLCAALHLVPSPNDGDDRLVKEFLR